LFTNAEWWFEAAVGPLIQKAECSENPGFSIKSFSFEIDIEQCHTAVLIKLKTFQGVISV